MRERLAICAAMALAGCGTGGDAATDAGMHFDSDAGCDPASDPGRELDDALFEYAYSCRGDVAPSGEPLPAAPVADDCTSGVWPDLDPTADVCATQSDRERTDPVSGRVLPPDDDRALPGAIPVTESGSFRDSSPAMFPATLKVVAWNVQYTADLDAQIAALTGHPDLADADVYLLSEVDRCSARNGGRRAARALAESIGGDYVYAIEFVELDIGRQVGGDTGQAIVSRRPLTGASVTCHSRQNDWFASDDEPRLGQRITLFADVPAGDRMVRIAAAHFESSDVLGDKRVVQVREALDRLQDDACDRPIVIGGDFNTWYCSAPELEVLRRSGFTDVLRRAGDIEPTHDNGLRIDYVWTRGVDVAAAGAARDVAASDHAPLWAELTIADPL